MADDALNAALFRAIARQDTRKPVPWTPEFEYARAGKTWHATCWVHLPAGWSGPFWANVTGLGPTRRAAEADCRHRLNKMDRVRALRRARWDPARPASDAIGDFTRAKMREDGFFRRIFPLEKRRFLRWGADGKAVFETQAEANARAARRLAGGAR